MSKSLLEIRNQFSKVMSDPANLDLPSRAIATAFFKSRRGSFPLEAWDEVTISGLVHTMGSLRKRRRPQKDSGQTLLFAGIDVDPIVVVRVVKKDGAAVERNKGTLSLTLAEARDYLSQHQKERATNTKLVREWRRLIARVARFMTREDMTIEEGLTAAAAAEELKKKEGGKA